MHELFLPFWRPETKYFLRIALHIVARRTVANFSELFRYRQFTAPFGRLIWLYTFRKAFVLLLDLVRHDQTIIRIHRWKWPLYAPAALFYLVIILSESALRVI